MDFSFSPEQPRAGKTILFSNLSDGGEEWSWDFGDASTSTSKNPSKSYKRAGTYTVTLMVDNKKSLRCSKQITVYDTIPGILCTTDSLDSIGSVGMFHEAVLRASIYNPYNYKMTYCWTLNRQNAVVLSDDTTSMSVKVLFRTPNKKEPVHLTIVQNGTPIEIDTVLCVLDQSAPALVMRTTAGDMRQRIYGVYYEDAYASSYATTDAALLDAVDETTGTAAGTDFTLASVSALTGESVLGFAIADRKIYYRTAEHVAVCNVGGQYKEVIDATAATALLVSRVEDRLFWATSDGVWAMRLIQSDNNKFSTVKHAVNSLSDVTVLAYDAVERTK